MRKIIGLLAIALAAASCAPLEPTRYRPADPVYGHSEQPRDDGVIEVGFAGNPATARETVEAYALFRAAELTLAAGHDGFDIVDRATEVHIRETVPRGTAKRPAVTRRGEIIHVVVPVSKPPRNEIAYAAFLTIRPFTATAIAETPLRHDARKLRARLDARILRPAR